MRRVNAEKARKRRYSPSNDGEKSEYFPKFPLSGETSRDFQLSKQFRTPAPERGGGQGEGLRLGLPLLSIHAKGAILWNRP